jgi:phage shock protein C
MEPKRKLYRSRANRTIAGVCCGLADYFGVDPTLIRVIFVVLNLLGGAGIVLYLLLWIIVPNEPEDHA